MKRTLVVVRRSEAFSALWSRLAEAAGAELRLELTDGRPELGDAQAVIVAAGGDEVGALSMLDLLRDPGVPPVCVVGATTDHRIAIALLQAGAGDYFALPGDLADLHSWVMAQAERAAVEVRARTVAKERRARYDFSQMIGRSPGFVAAIEQAARLIPNGNVTVLIQGETGTGKDLLAQAIHYNGPRGDRPLVELNCAALPETLLESELFGYEAGAFTDARSAKPGLFEIASGSSLFLDEIGDLSTALQGKLLRVLESGKIRRLGSVRDILVDVRVIAATHIDLDEAVRSGRFRQDLFYRLNVFPMRLPPLRARREDIPLLTDHFVRRFQAAYRFPEQAVPTSVRMALLGHHWPGNVRELRNCLERAVVLGDGALSQEDLFPQRHTNGNGADNGLPFPAPLRQINRAAAARMVLVCGGNKSRAARELGISRKNLYLLLEEGNAG